MGRNTMPVRKCPIAMARESDFLGLLPYFSDWMETMIVGTTVVYKSGKSWPDGRGRIYQSIKLISAFNVLMEYFLTVHNKK
jgi:hypothetical protein